MAGDIEGAFEAYKKSLSYDSLFVAAWVNMGLLFGGLGKLEEAERAIRAGIELEPDNPFALGSLAALILHDEYRQREAEDLLQKALQIEPTNSENWHHLGALQTMTNLEQAESAFCKSLELNPENPRTYVDFAMMLHKAERFLEAEDMARRATEMKPEDPWAWSTLAKALYAGGKVREGINTQVKATELEPDSTYQQDLLCFMYMDAGYVGRAEGALKQLIVLDPENVDAWERLFDVHRQIGDEKGLRESEFMFRLFAKKSPTLEAEVERLAPIRPDSYSEEEILKELSGEDEMEYSFGG